ncbi:unnamed protein product, partial [marine sediment metagenome]
SLLDKGLGWRQLVELMLEFMLGGRWVALGLGRLSPHRHLLPG